MHKIYICSVIFGVAFAVKAESVRFAFFGFKRLRKPEPRAGTAHDCQTFVLLGLSGPLMYIDQRPAKVLGAFKQIDSANLHTRNPTTQFLSSLSELRLAGLAICQISQLCQPASGRLLKRCLSIFHARKLSFCRI